MNDRARTLRNTFFSSVGVYTEYALGMLTSILIARHLGPDGFGAYGAVIWLVGLGIAMTNSGTASAAIKFVAELRGAGRDADVPVLLAYLRRAQRLFLAFVLLAGVAALHFGRAHFAPELNHWLLIAFLVFAVPLRAGYMFNIGVAKGYENFKATATVALVAAPANLLLVLAATLWLDGAEELLLGVFAVTSAILYGISRRQVTALVPASSMVDALPVALMARVRRHMLYSAMTVTVGFFAASEVEVMFLNLNGQPDAAGVFKVAYQLATGAAQLVPGVFAALMLPMMANALSQGREVAGRRFASATAYLLMLAAPLVAFGVVFSADVITTLYGARYADAAWPFAVCLVAFSLAVATQGASSLLISADRQRTVLMVVAACAALKLVLGATLVSRLGLQGAVAAYAIVTIVDAAALMWLAIRSGGASPDWSRLARIALAAALAGAIAWPLAGRLEPWAAVLAGGITVLAVYLPLSLLLACWSSGDIEHMQHLHARLGAMRSRPGDRMLAWALTRTERRSPP
jgi:O-antigen/teichoic acid export membrane protein